MKPKPTKFYVYTAFAALLLFFILWVSLDMREFGWFTAFFLLVFLGCFGQVIEPTKMTVSKFRDKIRNERDKREKFFWVVNPETEEYHVVCYHSLYSESRMAWFRDHHPKFETWIVMEELIDDVRGVAMNQILPK